MQHGVVGLKSELCTSTVIILNKKYGKWVIDSCNRIKPLGGAPAGEKNSSQIFTVYAFDKIHLISTVKLTWYFFQ